MTGILGLFGSLGGPAGGSIAPQGILGGGNLSGWDIASLAASGLQDAYAGYRGQPQGHLDDALATVRARAVRQSLSDLNSSDPAARQKAYMNAALLGIDTKPFQQQQAAQALPQLLQNMQPTPAGSVSAPAVSAPLSLPGGSGTLNLPQVSAQYDAAPGMNLSDALASTKSPELMGQLAPDVIKQQMEMQQKQATTLSPQEAAQAGFKPGAIVQRDLYGNFTVKQPSDVKSDAAVQQQIAIENQNPNLAIARANLGVSQAHLRLDQDKQAASLIDPLTRQQMAQQYLAGDPSVLTGLARGNPANIPLVRAEIQRQATALGMKGGDIATKMAEFKGLTAGERALGTRTAQVGMASNEFSPMSDQAEQAMKDLGPSGFMPLAKLEQAYQANTNNPKLAKAVAANNAVINTYARLINPNGVPTDSDKQHARDMLSTAQSLQAYQAALNQMRAEGAIARQAPSQARGEIGNLFSGPRAGAVQAPAPAANLPRSTASLPRIAPAQKIRVFNPATGRLE